MYRIILLFFIFMSAQAFSSIDKCKNIKFGSDLTYRIPTPQWLKSNLKISSNSKWLIKASNDGIAAILNIENGKEMRISMDSGIRDFQFSPDNKSIAIAGENGLVTIRSLETGKDLHLQYSDSVNTVRFSPDSKSLLIASANQKAVSRNLLTGKELVIKHKGAVNSAQYSPDGKLIITASADGTAKIVRLDSGKETIVKHNRDVIFAEFSIDGKSILTSSFDDTATVVDLETNKETIVKHRAGIAPQFSANGKTVLTSSNYKTLVIRNISTGKEVSVKHDFEIISARISTDGKTVISAGYDDTIIIKNIETGKEKKIPYESIVSSIEFTPDEKSIITTYNNGNVSIINIDSGLTKFLSHPDVPHLVQLTNDGSSLIIASKHEIISKVSLEEECVQKNVEISGTKKDCIDCVNDRTESDLPQIINISDIENTVIKSLCNKTFDEKDWANVAPSLPTPLSSVSKVQAIKYLYKYQKPDSIQLRSDLSTIMAILGSDLVAQHPELILGMMTSILVKSPNTYKQLLSMYPNVSSLKVSDFKGSQCRSKKDKEQIDNAVTSYLKNLKNEKMNDLEFNDLKELSFLTPILKNLAPAQKESLIDLFATLLSDNAERDPDYDGIFLSKLYKFSRQAVEPFFGTQPLPITDLTTTTTKDSVWPIILGVSAIDNGPQSKYGFYAKSLAPISFTSLKKSTATWKMDGKDYSADISLNKLSSSAVIPDGTSPDYKGLWKDKTLSGIVFAGSNLGASLTKGTMNRLLAYYQDQGFEFTKATGNISNLPNFLKNEIESGRVDYISKQAHSDGDEKNIFRINVKARYEEGIKTLPDGNTEKIFLVFPEALDTETVLISNNDFGEWIQNREKNKGEQLVYLNTSCWSYTKAVNEIQASNSSLLLNIPTMTTVYTFENSPTSAEYLLFQALREKKSFQEMRTNLEKNPLYHNNKEANYFIFPDEEKYKEEITTKVQNQPRITISIKDQNGKDYNIDQFGH